MSHSITFTSNHGPLPAGAKPTIKQPNKPGAPPPSFGFSIKRDDGIQISPGDSEIIARFIVPAGVDYKKLTGRDRLTRNFLDQSVDLVNVEGETEVTWFVGGKVEGHRVAGFSSNGKVVTRSADDLGITPEEQRRVGNSISGYEYTVIASPEIASGEEGDPVVQVVTKADLDAVEARLGGKLDLVLELLTEDEDIPDIK